MNTKYVHTNNVAKDWIDLRDNIYDPSLKTLRAANAPNPALFTQNQDHNELRFGTHHQGQSERCVGYALAALIDLQRRHQLTTDLESISDQRASANMLYSMARFHDRFTQGGSSGSTTEPTRELGATHNEGASEDATTAVAVTPRTGGVRSLRSVVKGLYHHGVFIESPHHPELTWQPHQSLPTIAQAKAARVTSLGAYYRLLPVLNHYHAALNDTGTVLVSACTHAGWAPSRVAANQGEIAWNGETGEGGQHAFVIVGYTERGFLVLNSWGPEWGGYPIHDNLPTNGIALWSYADWARNVVDGWVLRLGVSAPDAFDVSVGQHGLVRAYGTIRSGSTPCLELMGHYIHLDNGYYTELSTYPSNPEMIQETMRVLPEAIYAGVKRQTQADSEQAFHDASNSITTPDKSTINSNFGINNNHTHTLNPQKGLLLWISGSLEGMKAAFETAVNRKTNTASLDLYPFFVFWCNDFVEDAIKFLLSEFTNSARISGENASHRDQLIESSVRGIGRAFWREVESCARRGVWGAADPERDDNLREQPRGHLGEFLKELYTQLSELDGQIHIVADGAGALILDEMIRQFNEMDDIDGYALAQKITTINLVLPAIDLGLSQRRILPLLNALNQRELQQTPRQPDGTTPSSWVPPARIHVPTAALEQRVHIGDYGKTILHLIANAFEDRVPVDDGSHRDGRLRPEGEPKVMLGMAEAHRRYTNEQGQMPAFVDPFWEHSAVSGASDRGGRVSQDALTRDSGIEKDVLASIAHYSAKTPASKR